MEHEKDLIHTKCLSFQFVELSIFSALENDIAKAKKQQKKNIY